MFKGKDKIDINEMGDLNTVIGKGTVVEGTLTVQSSLRVDGKIKGKISCTDSIVVGKEGEIEGEVHVRNAVIGGRINGKINAEGKVILESKAVLKGDLKASKVVIDEGAVFNGNCLMLEEGKIEKGKEKAGEEFKAEQQKPKEKKVESLPKFNSGAK